jgi:hypothetical protein
VGGAVGVVGKVGWGVELRLGVEVGNAGEGVEEGEARAGEGVGLGVSPDEGAGEGDPTALPLPGAEANAELLGQPVGAAVPVGARVAVAGPVAGAEALRRAVAEAERVLALLALSLEEAEREGLEETEEEGSVERERVGEGVEELEGDTLGETGAVGVAESVGCAEAVARAEAVEVWETEGGEEKVRLSKLSLEEGESVGEGSEVELTGGDSDTEALAEALLRAEPEALAVPPSKVLLGLGEGVGVRVPPIPGGGLGVPLAENSGVLLAFTVAVPSGVRLAEGALEAVPGADAVGSPAVGVSVGVPALVALRRVVARLVKEDEALSSGVLEALGQAVRAGESEGEALAHSDWLLEPDAKGERDTEIEGEAVRVTEFEVEGRGEPLGVGLAGALPVPNGAEGLSVGETESEAQAEMVDWGE